MCEIARLASVMKGDATGASPLAKRAVRFACKTYTAHGLQRAAVSVLIPQKYFETQTSRNGFGEASLLFSESLRRQF